MTNQYVLPGLSGLLYAEGWAAFFLLASLVITFSRPMWPGETNQGNHLRGLGFAVAGMGMAISSLGVHWTPKSDPLDWLWLAILIGAALAAFVLVSTGTRIEKQERNAAIGRAYPASD